MIFPKMLIVWLPVNLKTVERPAWHFVQIPTAPVRARLANAAWGYLLRSPLVDSAMTTMTSPPHHRTVSNDFKGLALPLPPSSRHGLFGFLVFASGLFAIVLPKAKARHRSA
jgi:hypothetical protein